MLFQTSKVSTVKMVRMVLMVKMEFQVKLVVGVKLVFKVLAVNPDKLENKVQWVQMDLEVLSGQVDLWEEGDLWDLGVE